MLIFNNILINKNSCRFQPFLLNLISGKRRILNNYESNIIKFMKNDESKLNREERYLYSKLVKEEQFLTDEDRYKIEQELIRCGKFSVEEKNADYYSFSIELTRNCNMSCPYCYVKCRLNVEKTMTIEHIDSIYNFYLKNCDNYNKIYNTPYIRITGGEPLISEESIKLINYVAKKWNDSKIILFTNGVNLLKYYEIIPFKNIQEVHISLDGLKETHMSRRYSVKNKNYKIYDNIILGIKKLIHDEINVKIKATLDRTNYLEMLKFKEFLIDEGIYDSEYVELLPGLTLDYKNKLDIMESCNNKCDICDMKNYLEKYNISTLTFPSAINLFRILSRPNSEDFFPKIQRCDTSFLSKCYFSCNGKVYFCDCINENEGIVGTFYPEISINSNEVDKLINRSVINSKKCKKCPYKFVCLGGCPLSSRTKHEEMSCGIFGDEELLDDLEFNYYWIK